jgi:membrane fusion protein, hemolysin D
MSETKAVTPGKRLALWLPGMWRGLFSLGEKSVTNTQREFFPGALEVQESPPSPTGRWLIAILLALFTAAITWACIGSVDIVVSASGRIVPSGQVKIVQAPEAGTVRTIQVREGERVAAGTLLISLDPTYANADVLRTAERVDALAAEISWREALDDWLVERITEGEPIEGGPGGRNLNSTADEIFRQRKADISAQLDTLAEEHGATKAELAMVIAEGERVDVTLPILQDRVASYRDLFEKQFAAKVVYLEILQQFTELQSSVPILDAKEHQLSRQLAAVESRLRAQQEQYRTDNLLNLTRLRGEHGAALQERAKATQRSTQQKIYSPVDGTVEQLAIHTVGGVVTPAQELMKVIPANAEMHAEVNLQNKDVGFVVEGQAAEVKIDTFNFTRYGLIDAEVANISDDAVNDEQHGLVFPSRLLLKSDELLVEGRAVKLGPGMSITAEIRTGKRRLIEFFLSPLLRYHEESLGER